LLQSTTYNTHVHRYTEGEVQILLQSLDFFVAPSSWRANLLVLFRPKRLKPPGTCGPDGRWLSDISSCSRAPSPRPSGARSPLLPLGDSRSRSAHLRRARQCGCRSLRPQSVTSAILQQAKNQLPVQASAPPCPWARLRAGGFKGAASKAPRDAPGAAAQRSFHVRCRGRGTVAASRRLMTHRQTRSHRRAVTHACTVLQPREQAARARTRSTAQTRAHGKVTGQHLWARARSQGGTGHRGCLVAADATGFCLRAGARRSASRLPSLACSLDSATQFSLSSSSVLCRFHSGFPEFQQNSSRIHNSVLVILHRLFRVFCTREGASAGIPPANFPRA